MLQHPQMTQLDFMMGCRLHFFLSQNLLSPRRSHPPPHTTLDFSHPAAPQQRLGIQSRIMDKDVLEKHHHDEGCGGSRLQEHLQSFSLYARACASHKSSHSNSATGSHRSGSPLSASTTYTGSHYTSGKSNKRDPTPAQWNYYTDAQREVLCENFVPYYCSSSPAIEVTHSVELEKFLLDRMSHFRGELAAKAESYMKIFFRTSDPALLSNPDHLLEWKADHLDRITDAGNAFEFFAHKYSTDGKLVHWFGNEQLERFHVNFWYTHDHSPMNHSCSDPLQTTPLRMYALSAIALCCALDREAIAIDTRMAQQIQFCGKDYSPIYEEYFLALSKVMASESTLQTAFSARMDYLHQLGREGQRSRRDPPRSPRKQCNKVLIPTNNQLAAFQGQGPASVASTSYAPPLPSGSHENPFTLYASCNSYVDPTVGTSSSQGDYAGFQMYNSAVGDTAEPEACNFDYDYDYNL
ncbi:hypothetical protein JVT61DRAFT_3782 [Boletus reticuloceps]|uniref:DUF6532 domain-containing protein n=1 Tax=Boletus reticuloceps TaxID=495285 RepID=A0A8I3A9Y8_9AGAM|nr:hypothetical protein JVT61DRAFT_3782 [Boletus reticuloceps]